MDENKRRLTVPPDLEAELADLIQRGKKVSATKRLREATGAGLAEAKQWVDEYLAAHFRKRS